jgi:hypothetical protein
MTYVKRMTVITLESGKEAVVMIDHSQRTEKGERMTVITVEAPMQDSSNTLFTASKAVCGLGDQFRRTTGRQIAGRRMARLLREEVAAGRISEPDRLRILRQGIFAKEHGHQ